MMLIDETEEKIHNIINLKTNQIKTDEIFGSQICFIGAASGLYILQDMVLEGLLIGVGVSLFSLIQRNKTLNNLYNNFIKETINNNQKKIGVYH